LGDARENVRVLHRNDVDGLTVACTDHVAAPLATARRQLKPEVLSAATREWIVPTELGLGSIE